MKNNNSNNTASDKLVNSVAQSPDSNNEVSGDAERDSTDAVSAGEANNGTKKRRYNATALQLILMVFIAAFATKTFLLPIFLIRNFARDGYIGMAIICGADLLSLFTVLAAVKIADCDIFKLIVRAFGNTAAKVFFCGAFLFFFIKINIVVAEIMIFYADSVFADFNTAVMIIALLIFLAAVSAKKMTALCRLNELIVPVIIVCLGIFICIIVVTGFDFANILPSMRGDMRELRGLGVWLGDFTPLIFFVGTTKPKKRTLGIAAASGTVGSCVAVFFALVLSAAFGNVPMLVDSGTNVSGMLQFSSGNVYGRIDLFTSALWSLAAFVQSAVFMFVAVKCLAFVFGKRGGLAFSIPLGIVVYFVQVLYLAEYTAFFTAAVGVWSTCVSATFAVLLPSVVLWAAIKTKRRSYSGVGDSL